MHPKWFFHLIGNAIRYPPFYPTVSAPKMRLTAKFSFKKKTYVYGSLKHWGCGADKVSLAQRSASSFLLTALWLCFQQYMIYFPLVNISCLQKDCYSLCSQWIESHMLSKEIHFFRQTIFTCMQALFTASISAVKYAIICKPVFHNLFSIITNICRSHFCFNFRPVSVHVTKIKVCLL